MAWELQQDGSSYDGSTEVDESTAVKPLVRYVRLHQTNISKKLKIVDYADIFAMLSKALPAMLYEALRGEKPAA